MPSSPHNFGDRCVPVRHGRLDRAEPAPWSGPASVRPCGPRARAARRPATVRSRMSSLSNSASAAKMPNERRPAAVVVSICAPLASKDLEANPADRRAPSRSLPGDAGCAPGGRVSRRRVHRLRAAPVRHASRPGALVLLAGGVVRIDAILVDAGGQERVVLQVARLAAVGLRDPGVADQYVSQTFVCERLVPLTDLSEMPERLEDP